MENNDELLAEFMNMSLTFTHDTGSQVVERKLTFHKFFHQWNHLMPIVEKIATIDDYSQISMDASTVFLHLKDDEMQTFEVEKYGSLKSAVYAACVFFVKWLKNKHQ